jgi:hypothetical protein
MYHNVNGNSRHSIYAVIVWTLFMLPATRREGYTIRADQAQRSVILALYLRDNWYNSFSQLIETVPVNRQSQKTKIVHFTKSALRSHSPTQSLAYLNSRNEP